MLPARRASHARSERLDDQLAAGVAALPSLKLQRSACRLDEKVICRVMPAVAAQKDWHARSERPLDQANDGAAADLKEQRPSASRLDVNSIMRS